MKLSKSIALLVIPVTTLTLTACQDLSQGANLLVKALATPSTIFNQPLIKGEL